MKKLFASRYGAVAAIVLMLFAAGRLAAQQDAGVLRVLAEDQSGSAIGQVAVKVTNSDTNTSTSQVTNAEGYATFSPIARGRYMVEVSHAGFSTVTVRDVEIDVNQNRLETVMLQVSGVSTHVEVTADASAIQTEDASLGQVVSGNVIEELPLAARRYTDLTLLVPGASESTVDPTTRGPGWLVVNGNSQIMNNFLLDGFDNNQNTHNLQSRSPQVMAPSPDTLSEFKVQTDNYSAEFGRAMGAVINASIKSGTNQWHGSAWWYNRDAALAANSWEANWQGTGKSDLQWNQEGGTLGGPIVKDKLFIFGDYENFRSLSSSPAFATVPTMAERNGDFSALTVALTDPASNFAPFPGNQIPASRFDPLAKKVFDMVYPAPNYVSGVSGTAGRPSQNYSAAPQTTDFVNKFDIRSDYYWNATNRFFIRYSFSQDSGYTDPTMPGLADTGSESGGPQYARNQSLGISWNRTFSPTMVNELRYGYTKTASNFSAATNGKETGTDFGFQGLPEDLDSVGGLPRMAPSGYSALGVGTYRPQYSNPYAHQINDTFSLIRGKQTWKFGVDYRFKDEVYSDPQYRVVSYTFDSNYTKDGAADMLLGMVQSLSAQTFKEFSEAQTLAAAYAQDDWKIRPNLTINLGLRYEFTSPSWGRNGVGNVNYDFLHQQLLEAPGLPLIYGGQTGSNKYLQNPDYTDFGPRVGIAYQILPKLVLRSGFGIFFNGQDIHGSSEGALLFAPPNTYNLSLTRVGLTGAPPAILSQPLPASLLDTSTILASNVTIEARPQDRKTGEVYQWNTALQFQTSRSSNFEVAYVGNVASHLDDTVNPNNVPWGQDGSVLANRRFQQFRAFDFLEYRAGAHYNALQAKFEKRFASNWYNLTSYTYASGLSDTGYFGAAGGGGTQYEDFSGPIPEPIMEQGFTDQISRQRLSVTNIWKLPFGRGQRFLTNMPKVLEFIAGGWQTQFILITRSGLPVNVSLSRTGVNPLTGQSYSFYSNEGGGAIRPNRVGDPNTGISPENDRLDFLNVNAFSLQTINTPGNAGRNTAWGPPSFNIDTGLTKRFSITETKAFDFRFEMFNMMNHVNFGQPNSTWGAANFGQITTAADPRQIQMALRFAF